MRFAFASLALLSALLLPVAAHADSLTYTFTGVVNGSFSIDSSATPSFVDPEYFQATFTAAAGDFAGWSGAYFITHPDMPYGGDLQVPVGDDFIVTDGVALFTGLTSAPVYLTGHFDLTNFADDSPVSLNVVDTSASVTPEPSSLVLLGTGALGLFGVARRRFHRA